MSTESSLRTLAQELHLIRKALERMSPPPEETDDDDKPKKGNQMWVM